MRLVFLTHLQESGHLHRRVAGWREPRGSGKWELYLDPRGKAGGEEGGSLELASARNQVLPGLV